MLYQPKLDGTSTDCIAGLSVEGGSIVSSSSPYQQSINLMYRETNLDIAYESNLGHVFP